MQMKIEDLVITKKNKKKVKFLMKKKVTEEINTTHIYQKNLLELTHYMIDLLNN